MKALKWTGAGLLGLIALAGLLIAAALAFNYRPGAVLGQRLEAAKIESLEGGQVGLSDYAGRVILVAFATNG